MNIDYKSYQLIEANVFQNSILDLIFYIADDTNSRK